MKEDIKLDRKILENAFPKSCKACGKEYSNYDNFLSDTKALDKGVLSQGPKQTVLAYRNCKCGSTLTIKLEDLRDYSEEGIKRREAFKKRLSQLEESGVKTKDAISQVKKEMGL